jgi:hypothetical protein
MFDFSGVPLGANLFDATLSTANNGVNQIINPSSNVNGIFVRNLGLTVENGGIVAVYAGPLPAPTGPSDPTLASKHGIFSVLGNQTAWMPYPFYMPSGFGLWAIAPPAPAPSSMSISWDLNSL